MAPIRIFYKNDQGYHFNNEAFRDIMLKAGKNPIAIYSVNGPLRMGKSFLLNQFIKYLECNEKNKQDNWIDYQLNDAFEFRSGVQRTTVGIDMWDRPYILKGPKGEKVAVYFMDTQGCFDQQTDNQENAVIFAMSTLLSSNMIFNVMKQVDESKYQFLEYFVHYARLGDGKEYREDPFARLMILIRDFQSNDYDYGYYDSKTSINGKNYKKDLFDVNKDQAKEVQVVHQKIAETFENISFFLMSEPGKELGKYGRFDTAKADEDFVDNLKQLVTLVLKPSNLVLKRISGQLVYGSDLAKLAGKWSQFFNSDDMPDSRTLFQSVIDLKNGMAQTSAMNYFDGNIRNVIKEKQGVPHNEFEDLLRTELKSALDYYKCRMKGYDQKSLGSFIEELEEKLDKQSTYLRDFNCSEERIRVQRVQINQQLHEVKKLKQDQEDQRRLLETTGQAYQAKIQALQKDHKSLEQQWNYEKQVQKAQDAKKQEEIDAWRRYEESNRIYLESVKNEMEQFKARAQALEQQQQQREREQQAREQQAREQQAREQQAREQLAREQQARQARQKSDDDFWTLAFLSTLPRRN